MHPRNKKTNTKNKGRIQKGKVIFFAVAFLFTLVTPVSTTLAETRTPTIGEMTVAQEKGFAQQQNASFDALATAQNLFNSTKNKTLILIADIKDGATNVFGAFRSMGKKVQNAGSRIVFYAGKSADGLSSVVQGANIAQGATDSMSFIAQGAKNGAEKAWKALQSMGQAFSVSSKSVIAKTGAFTSDFAYSAKSAGKAAGSGLSRGAQGAQWGLGSVIGGAKNSFGLFGAGLGQGPKVVAVGIGQIVSNFGQGTVKTLGGVGTTLGKMSQAIPEMSGDMGRFVYQFGASTSCLGDGVYASAESTVKGVSRVAQGAKWGTVAISSGIAHASVVVFNKAQNAEMALENLRGLVAVPSDILPRIATGAKNINNSLDDAKNSIPSIAGNIANGVKNLAVGTVNGFTAGFAKASNAVAATPHIVKNLAINAGNSFVKIGRAAGTVPGAAVRQGKQIIILAQNTIKNSAEATGQLFVSIKTKASVTANDIFNKRNRVQDIKHGDDGAVSSVKNSTASSPFGKGGQEGDLLNPPPPSFSKGGSMLLALADTAKEVAQEVPQNLGDGVGAITSGMTGMIGGVSQGMSELGDIVENIPSVIGKQAAGIGKSVVEFGKTIPEKTEVFTQDSAESLKEIFVESPQVVGKASWQCMLSFGRGIKNLAYDIKLALQGRKIQTGSTVAVTETPVQPTQPVASQPSGTVNPPQVIVREVPAKTSSILGSTTINGTLTLNGNALFKGNETRIAAPLFLENNFNINSVFSVDAATGNLISAGDIKALGKLSAKDLAVTGTVDFTGATVIGLATSGGTVINNYTNNYHYSSGGSGSTIAGQFEELNIKGVATIGGSLSAGGDLTVNGNATLGDAASDIVTINASVINVPNGITFSNGAVSFGPGGTATSTFNGNIAVNGTGTSTFAYGATFATSGGSVGIGTSTPTGPFQVVDGSTNYLTFDSILANTFIGQQSGNFSTTGTYNTAVGNSAMFYNTGGYKNTALGHAALYNNSTGFYNTAIGYEDLYYNTTGYGNTALGYYALLENTTGYHNTALGDNPMHFNTTGYYNTAVGYVALYNNTTGTQNNAFGVQALYSNATGTDNNAFGLSALYNNTGGYSNTAIGNIALFSNKTGYNNNAIGYYTLFNNTTGYQNNALGNSALYYNTTGYNNTAVGNGALITNTTGYGNTALGVNADVTSANLYNATVLGYSAQVSASNTLVLGGAGAFAVNVGIGTASPSSTLEIFKSTGPWFTIGNGSASTTIGGYSATATSTNPYGALFANLGGNVGIGTSSPAYKLDVNGTIQVTDIISKGPMVDVRAFGAKGDGVTDDTLAIQAAIDSISVGTVFFPSGTYKTTATTTIKSNIRILGSERKASIISFAGTGAAISFADESSYFQIENMTIKANSTSATAGISGDHPKFLNLTNVILDGNAQTGFTTACIHITGSSPANTYSLNFDKIITNRCGGDGIKFSGTGGGFIVNITNSGIHDSANYGINAPNGSGSGWSFNIMNNEIEGNYIGQLYLENLYNSQISGNYFEEAGDNTTIPIVLNTVTGSYGVNIDSNFIAGHGTYGITAGTMYGGSISRNWFQGMTSGVNLGNSQDVDVVGNFDGGTLGGNIVDTTVGAAYKNIRYVQNGVTKFITQSGLPVSIGTTYVGIGTLSPSHLLTLASSSPALAIGNGSATSTLRQNTLSINTTSGYNLGYFYVDSLGNVTASGTIVSRGFSTSTLDNVVIGGSTPSSAYFTRTSSTLSSIYNGLFVGTTATTSIYGQTTSTFPYGVTFATTGGNVGIGTASPNANLTVLGSSGIIVRESDNGFDAIQIQGAATRGLVSLNEGGVLKILLDGGAVSYFNAGNVGFGTTIPSEKLTVVGGNIAVGNGSTATTTLTYGNRGAATSTFYSDLSIISRDLLVGGAANSGWGYFGDGTATTTIRGGTAGLATSTFQGDVSIANLYLGGIEFATDNGLTDFVNAPVSASATTGTLQGGALLGDGIPSAIWGCISDASGSCYNWGLGVNTSTLYYGQALNVQGNAFVDSTFTARTAGLFGAASGATSTLTVAGTSPWLTVGNGTASTTIAGYSLTATSTHPYGINFATLGGNVGIGTASPGYKLQINDESMGENPTAGVVNINTNDTGYDTLIISNAGTDPGVTPRPAGIHFKSPTYGLITGYSSGRIISYFDTTRGSNPGFSGAVLGFQYPTSDNTFTTGLVLRNGNVGIGTTNPSERLTVMGGGGFSVGNGYTTSTMALNATSTFYSFQPQTTAGNSAFLFNTTSTMINGNIFDWQDNSQSLFTLSASGTLRLYNQHTNSPSSTQMIIRAGGGQSTDNMLTVQDNSASTLFSVNNTLTSINNPLEVAVAGDVGLAYDLEFTNPDAAYIKSQSPLYITAGDPNQNHDLTMSATGDGEVIVADNFVVYKDYVSTSGTQRGAYVDVNDTGWMTGTLIGLDVDVSGVASGTVYSALFQGGLVGIGNSAPTSTLDLTSATSTRAVAIIRGASGQAKNMLEFRNSSDSLLAYFDQNGNFSTSGTTSTFSYGATFATAGGNVGIGTASPSANLTVKGSGTGLVQIGQLSDSTSYGAINFGSALNTTNYNFSSVGTDLYVRSNSGDIWFRPAGVDSVVFKSNGYVGIGTTNPMNLLTLFTSATSSPLLAIGNGAGTTTIAGGVAGSATSTFAGDVSIPNLYLGSLIFDTDAGIVDAMDLPISASAAAGTLEGYNFSVDGIPVLSVIAQSNGSGEARNGFVGIGTMYPSHLLTMVSSSPTLAMGTGSATTTITVGNRGVATSTFYSDLSIINRDLLVGGSANSGWLYIGNGTATTSIRGGAAGLATSTFEGDVSIANLYSGMLEFGVDSGVVGSMNMPVSASASDGSLEGYSFMVDGIPAMSIVGISNGAGETRNNYVGIGTMYPSALLTVVSSSPQIALGTGSATTTLSVGNRGVATSSFYSDLSIVNRDALIGGAANSGWLYIGDGTATTSIRGGTAGSATSTFQGDVSIANLYVGSTEFGVDAGIVDAMDLPVSASAAAGTLEGYNFLVDGQPTLSIIGQSNGAGEIKNAFVGIGTMYPSHLLTMVSSSPTLAMGTGSATTTITVGNRGAATSSFYSDLSIVSRDVIIGGGNGTGATGWLWVGNGTATTSIRGGTAGLATSTFQGDVLISNLYSGLITFSDDGGLVDAMDIPVSSSAATGTEEGYGFLVDGLPAVSVKGTSEAQGSVWDLRLELTDNKGTATTTIRGTTGTTSTFAGNVQVNGQFAVTGQCTEAGGACADIAEQYNSVDEVEAGDVVVSSLVASSDPSMSPYNSALVEKSKIGYADNVVGVVSTNPGLTLGLGGIRIGSGGPGGAMRPNIALAGRVPVKVTDENGTIKKGDYLVTSSAIPGYAMKYSASSTLSGFVNIFAMALDDWDPSTELSSSVIPAQAGIQSAIKTNKVTVLVKNVLVQNNNFGDDLTITEKGADIIADGEYFDFSGKALVNIKSLSSVSGSWSLSEAGEFVAKSVKAKVVSLNELIVAGDKETDASGAELDPAVGNSFIPNGEQVKVIYNNRVKKNSQIFITFRDNTGGPWWISNQGDGFFEVSVPASMGYNIRFSFWIVSVEGGDSDPSNPKGYDGVTQDTTAPEITSVAAVNITDAGATINWSTSEDADSVVVFATSSPSVILSDSEGSQIPTSIAASDLTSSHSLNLTSLTPQATYYYIVKSTDSAGNVSESQEYSFTTASPSIIPAQAEIQPPDNTPTSTPASSQDSGSSSSTEESVSSDENTEEQS